MLSQELNDRLRAQARRLGVSLASLCHLAWGQVLARSSGKNVWCSEAVLFGRMLVVRLVTRPYWRIISQYFCRCGWISMVQERKLRCSRPMFGWRELLVHEHASLALAQRCSGIAAPNPLFSAILNYRYGVAAFAGN